jgi:hypothetical protein
MVMSRLVMIGAVVLAMVSTAATRAQQTTPNFGGAYAGLDERRQQLINDWVLRFMKATGQSVEPGGFYDDIVNLSTKTTFDAVTHALMTTRLTDRSAARRERYAARTPMRDSRNTGHPLLERPVEFVPTGLVSAS